MARTRGVHRTRRVKIPIGIEKVLVKAASDPVFRQGLLDSREPTLKELGSDLSDAEFGILVSIPNDSLLTMVSHVDLKKHARRKFMKGVMTAAFVAASAATMAECSKSMVQGVRADDPQKKAATVEAQELHYDGGAAPTMPEEPPKPPKVRGNEDPDDLEVDTPVTRGIDPDRPPPPPPPPPDVIEKEETPVPAGIPPINPTVKPDPETRIINEMTIGGISPSDGPHLEVEAPETMGEGGHDPSAP